MTTRRLAAAAAALTLSLALGACGNKHAVVTHGSTEGIYLDVGPLKYQVQDSRQLNPAAIPEDRTFISDVRDTTLAPGQVWFAVFVRVENEHGDAQPLATSFEIVDADRDVFRPVPIGPANPFRYVASKLAAKSVAPNPDAIAGQTSINGLELLFKVTVSSLEESRPLLLKIHSPTDPAVVADVDLDV